VSEATERTRRAPRQFIGKLRLASRSAPQPEPAVVSLPAALAAPAPVAAASPPAPPGTAERVAALALCREAFPTVFGADNPLPLAIGIHEQLGELIGSDNASGLLRWWTGWPPYLVAVAAGGKRYHLDGTEAGAITERQREVARVALANRAAGGLPPASRSKRPVPARKEPVP
jgi:hypothetical protein